jgi:predicted Rossmann fold nucleotide-binding protein DprA/Smf involved in DNA uptake
MNRNKHIYALGDGTVVAHSAVGSGGTWAGATENLKHEWVPLFVLAKPPIPEGNQKLIEMGGFPIDRRVLQEGVQIADWLSGDVSPNKLTPMATRLAGTSAIDPLSPNSAEDTSSFVEVDVNSLLDEQDEPELFPLVWPALKTLLDEARSEQEVREYFSDLRLGQARDWLMAAVDRGLAIRTERPVRYKFAATDDAEDEIGSGGSEESDEEINQSVEGNSADSDPNSDEPSEVKEMRNASSEAPDLFSESG